MAFGWIPAKTIIQWEWPAGPAETNYTMGMAAGWISELPLYNYHLGQKYNVMKFGMELVALLRSPTQTAAIPTH